MWCVVRGGCVHVCVVGAWCAERVVVAVLWEAALVSMEGGCEAYRRGEEGPGSSPPTPTPAERQCTLDGLGQGGS